MMKCFRFNRLILLALLALICLPAVAGCGSSPGWEASLDAPPAFKAGGTLPLALNVTGQGQPVTGLMVTAVLEMTRMEHDQLRVVFTEKGGGVYQAEVLLPMDGEWSADIHMEKNGKSKELTVKFQSKAEASKPVAAVGDMIITQDDLDFYALANQLQSRIDQTQVLPLDKNSLLTQVIRLQAVGLLAKEKGYQADSVSVSSELGKHRAYGATDPALRQAISSFDAARFWRNEETRLTLLNLARQVQDEIRDKIKNDRPQASPKEIGYQTAQAYEDLVASQIAGLHIRFF
jgi:uncharacterized protein YfeS